MSNLFSNFLLCAAKIPPPSKDVAFPNIHKKALPLWDDFLTKYKKQIKEYGKQKADIFDNEIQGQWVIAKIIFERYCAKRNVPAFNENMSEKTGKPMKISNIVTRLQSVAKQLVLKLYKIDFLTPKVSKEKLVDIYFKLGSYSIISTSTVKVEDSSINYRTVFSGLSFTEDKKNTFVYNSGSHSINVKVTKELITITKQLVFTEQQLKLIFSLSDGEVSDKLKVKKILNKEIKTLFSEPTNILGKHLMTSNVDANGTDENLEGEKDYTTLDAVEKINLEHLKETISKSDPNIIQMTYNIDYITSLGTPAYQYALVQFLHEFMERNKIKVSLYSEILNNPEYYL